MNLLGSLRAELRLMIEQLRVFQGEQRQRSSRVRGASVEDEEIDDLIQTCLAAVREVVNVRDLDERAAAREHIDLSPVWQVVEMLTERGAESWSYELPSRVETGSELVRRLQVHRKTFDGAQRKHGPEEANFRIWLGLDQAVLGLLILGAHENVDLGDVEHFVASRLRTLTAEDIAGVWRSIQREVAAASERTDHFTISEDLVPRGFFGLGAPDVLRSRIAHYVVQLKPRAIVRNGAAGHYSFPVDAPGVAMLLATRGDGFDLRPHDEWLIRSLARLMSVTPEYRRSELASALGLSPDAWICRRTHFATAPETKVSREHALRILERLLARAEVRYSAAEHVEVVLLRYKLGLEICREESAASIEAVSELVLQRRFCKFLIEQGVRAFGTRFDNADTDVLAQPPDAGEPYIIEVKFYRAHEPPSKSRLEKHLQQLQKYVDQHHQGARGVLLIFNLSDVPIKAERVWLGRQYRVVAINLGTLAPSKLRGTVEVLAGSNGALLEIIESGAPTTRRSLRRPPRRAKRER